MGNSLAGKSHHSLEVQEQTKNWCGAMTENLSCIQAFILCNRRCNHRCNHRCCQISNLKTVQTDTLYVIRNTQVLTYLFICQKTIEKCIQTYIYQLHACWQECSLEGLER